MDALTLLLNRRSVGKLTEPAPQGDALENILQAGLRAPDHGKLRPYRFFIIEKTHRQAFGDILVKAVDENELGEKQLDKAKNAPFRAPMIIAVIAHCEAHPKVPLWEQVVTAGCAVHAMQMAAVAQGFGGIWLTGPWTDCENVREAFDCRAQDVIVGFLYLGTPLEAPADVKAPNSQDYTQYFK